MAPLSSARFLLPLMLVSATGCGAPPTDPGPGPGLAGDWAMTQLDGASVPAVAYRFENEIVDGVPIALVEIRLDSATARLAAGGRYDRAYYFSEWHDGRLALRYGWGDFGNWARTNGSVRLESEYIQNLRSDGTVRSDGRLALREPLNHGESLRQTVWSRRGD